MRYTEQDVERVGEALAQEIGLNPEARIEWWPVVERQARAALEALEREPLVPEDAVRVEAWEAGGFWNASVFTTDKHLAGSDGDAESAIRNAVAAAKGEPS